ncbi:tetratricopeptide repeat protein [Calothrix sp. 336/3]|uniref:tetratricopeptide repeat protein n=1 Tax=Calothrix sp. 336/3 TaxID=1337936 RepID=UPI0004E43684|nr:tetratricopeptide repeat protein [Calothrix sp. 336/3]AKG22126.1 tetratricopeptide TPR_1 repeat-containing protein [Calothrix sp. 336/3]
MIQKRKGINGKGVISLSLLPFYFLVMTAITSVSPLLSLTVVQAQTSSATVQKGFNLLKKGWVNDAIATFQQALKRQPQSLQAKLGLAIAYNRAGRIPEAWNAYQQVLAQDPNNQSALKIVGIMGTYRPEWNRRGINALTTLLQLNPSDTQARGYRALLYSYQGQFSEAIADYQIALNNNPTPDIIIGAAQAYSYGGDYSRALELFNRYRTTGKSINGFAAVAYATSLRQTGNIPGAIQVLEAQLQNSTSLDSVAIETRSELAKAYLANNQQAQALAILDPLRGRSEAILPLARSLNEIRQRNQNPTLAQEVANLYRQVLNNNPNPSPNLLREIADVFTGLPGGEQTALQLYRQAAIQQPNDQSLQIRQLAMENKLGMISKTELRQRLATILQTLPNDGVKLQQIAVAVADIDNPDPELLTVYQSLLHSKLNNGGIRVPFLYFRLAQIYAQKNDLVGARQALAAYTSTPEGKRSLIPQLMAAEIERREGSLEASAKRYQAVLNTQPNSEITDAALRGLAGVRLQQRRYDDALAVYDQLLSRQPSSLITQLGRTSVALQANRIVPGEAEAVLNNWLATQPITNTPPELFSLVGVLPATTQREPLYNYLAQVDPSYIPVQKRLVEAIALRSPAQAKITAKQIIANNPNSYQLQAEVARAAGDLDLASKTYETVLSQQPDNVDALAALGGIRFEQQRFTEAQQIYSRVLEQKPEDRDSRRALADLTAIDDQPLAALAQLEQLQIEQGSQGGTDSEVSRRMQEIQEDFLQRRGFQPPWEDYQRRQKK